MDQQTNDLIKNEIESNDVCLFMKGTPDAPQCGFSMATSNILKLLEVNFKGINVLEDQKKVLDILVKNAVHYDELGTINENMLFLNEKTKVTIDELKGFNTKWLKEYMSN